MNRLKELRKNKGITQDDLAKILNVQRSAISKYESGFTPLTDDNLIVLSDYFDVSVDCILGLPDKKIAPAINNDYEGDESINETIEIMESLPKSERKNAVRFLRAAYADRQEISDEPDDAGELKEE